MKLRDYRFSKAQLSSKPGPKGKTLTYVDVRVIAAVLDELAPGWTSTTQLAHNGNEYSAIVSLTVDGLSRADVGSGDTPPDAQNQAFRRAAAQHGLGAYLWIGDDAQPARAQRTATTADLVGQFNTLGESLYGAQWSQVRRRNVERISQGATVTCEDLSAEQLGKLIAGLKTIQRQRQAA